MTQNNTKDHNRKKRISIIAVAIIALIIIILLLLRGCASDSTASAEDRASFSYDSEASEGGWDKIDKEAIVECLNEKVAAGMINISMNTAPVFSNGTEKGNLMIVNENINNYPQIVVITRNDTGEVIYKSGGIPVGSKIESAKLGVPLQAGTYECTAMFHNVDPATGESVGCAGAIITITVLE